MASPLISRRDLPQKILIFSVLERYYLLLQSNNGFGLVVICGSRFTSSWV